MSYMSAENVQRITRWALEMSLADILFSECTRYWEQKSHFNLDKKERKTEKRKSSCITFSGFYFFPEPILYNAH